MFVADADVFAGVAECFFGEAVFAAEGVAADVAEEGDGISE